MKLPNDIRVVLAAADLNEGVRVILRGRAAHKLVDFRSSEERAASYPSVHDRELWQCARDLRADPEAPDWRRRRPADLLRLDRARGGEWIDALKRQARSRAGRSSSTIRRYGLQSPQFRTMLETLFVSLEGRKGTSAER